MKKLICSIAVVLCLTLLLFGNALAAGENVFGGGAWVDGRSVTVRVTLNAEDVHSAQLTVKYNPEELTLVSAKAGEIIKAADIQSLSTEVSGEVAFGFASLQAVETGTALEMNFRCTVNYDVDLTVEVVDYQTGDGEGVNTEGSRFMIFADTGDDDHSQDVTTGDKTQEGATATETTATPEASVSGSTASAQVSRSMGNEIVKQAETNDSNSVVIAPKMSGDITKTEVTVPGAVVSNLGERTGADLRVVTPVADVTIPNEALSELGKEGSVTVSAQIDDDKVTVDVSAGGKSVSSVTGGLRAALPLEDGQVAVLVAPDGTETIIPKSVVDNGVTYVVLDGSATVKVVDNAKDFNDVKPADWFVGAVDFATSHELFGGTSVSTFEPDAEMTRAMVTTVLWRLESESDAAASAIFPDVPAGQWYTEGVAWASEAGIVKGHDTGKFGTDDPVTRQELAVMLSRYAKLMGIDTTGSANLSVFTDGEDTDDWAEDSVKWAVSAGLLRGGDGKLDPTGTATRAEVATILQRLVDLIVK